MPFFDNFWHVLKRRFWWNVGLDVMYSNENVWYRCEILLIQSKQILGDFDWNLLFGLSWKNYLLFNQQFQNMPKWSQWSSFRWITNDLNVMPTREKPAPYTRQLQMFIIAESMAYTLTYSIALMILRQLSQFILDRYTHLHADSWSSSADDESAPSSSIMSPSVSQSVHRQESVPSLTIK